ncbi:MAG: SRPBCC family protein [Chthoniobacterales bacterium]
MFAKILIGLALIVVVFVAIVAMQPSEFRVSRSTTIDAPPAMVFDQINNLHNWQEWSPWAKLDPLCKITFEGPPAGVGASFSWAGNDQVGVGKMTNIESMPNDRVRFRLDFVKPFAGTSEAKFSFQPSGNQTVVTWTMSGKNNFIAKAVSLFMNCDAMLGPQFEKGLSQLKSLAEAAHKHLP